MTFDPMLYRPDLWALLSVLSVVGAFAGLGRLFGRRAPETWLVSGWAVACIAATLTGVLTTLPLASTLYPFLALSVAAWAWDWRRTSVDAAPLGKLLAVGLPLLLVVAAMSASQWDEFAHWLVNQRYLMEIGTFPRQGLPANPTIFAAYPYGLPLAGFLASRLAGEFVENAGALFNTILILVLSLLAVRSFRGTSDEGEPLSWMECAAGFLAATVLNPVFVPKLVFTTYADWTTCVVLAVAVAAGWRMIGLLCDGAVAGARNAALQLGLACALLISLKQPNVILVLLLLIGIALSALLAGGIPRRHQLHLAWRILLPGLLTHVVWRFHVATHLPAREFSFMPLADWLWGDLGAILGRMLLIASKKGGYFGLMLVATGLAVHGIAQALRRREISSVEHLAIVTATLFVGYNGFLYIAYIGAFGEGEGRNAASFWRYNTQLGGVALIFAAAAIGRLRQRGLLAGFRPQFLRLPIIAVALIVPLLALPKIRFDLNPVTRYVRNLGSEMAQLLPPGSRLVVIDTADNGKRALLLRYETAGQVRIERLAESDVSDAGLLRHRLDSLPASYVWVHVPTANIARALAVDLAPLSSYLLAPEGSGWRVARSWPYPGYSDPLSEDD